MSRALLIVDVQNDFTAGAALEVPGANEIIPVVKRLARLVDHLFATRDWHPPDHASFVTQGGEWPVHCVEETRGAHLHEEIAELAIDTVVDVGQGRDDEGFSGFEKSPLAGALRDRGVDELLICGLATDYCVRATVLSACEEGFTVVVLDDAIRAINRRAGDGALAIRDMLSAGAQVTVSSELPQRAPADQSAAARAR